MRRITKLFLFFSFFGFIILIRNFNFFIKKNDLSKNAFNLKNNSSEFSDYFLNKIDGNGISVLNFDQQYCSKSKYDSIKCRKSVHYYVSTTLCIHDIKKDKMVSGMIWQNGIWEPHVIYIYLDLLKKNPDALVFDVGAQIGSYSLFAAKMGLHVISVEPFYENILRIQKAVKIENLENKITLVRNAVSNKKGEIKRLYPQSEDIGGQGLVQFENYAFNKSDMKNDIYLVETIYFDDLISIIPKREDGSEYRKAVIKIDIEGYEPYAFESASNLFQIFDIQAVFIEWFHVNRLKEQYMSQIENMFMLFKKQDLVPYYGKQKIDINAWNKWPFDLYWIKEISE